MGEQRGLDVGRRHPHPGHLEQVVGSAGVMVEAVGVTREHVAGAKPLADERSPAEIEPVPVAGARRRPCGREGCRLVVPDLLAGRVDQAHLGPRHRRARRPGAALAGAIRQHHEDRLAGAQPVEDLDAEALTPRLVDVDRQPLAGRHAGAHSGRRRRAEGRHAAGRPSNVGTEKNSVGAKHSGTAHTGGIRPRGLQIRAGATWSGQQRVAQRVREEQPGRREHPIARVGAQDVDAVVPAREQIPMQMDRRFRPPGRAGRVEPEGHVVPADRLGRQVGGRLRQQRGESGVAGAGRDHRAQVRQIGEGDQASSVASPTSTPRPAVAQHRGPGGRVEARVERHRHRADAQCAEKPRPTRAHRAAARPPAVPAPGPACGARYRRGRRAPGADGCVVAPAAVTMAGWSPEPPFAGVSRNASTALLTASPRKTVRSGRCTIRRGCRPSR